METKIVNDTRVVRLAEQPSTQRQRYDNDRASKMDAERRARECQRAWDTYISDRGIRYADCRLDNFQTSECTEQSHAVQRLSKFAETDNAIRQNLILFGPTGRGKDHLLTGCVHRRLCRGHFSVRWTSGPRLFSALRSAMNDRHTTEHDIILPLEQCQVLVLSDVSMTTLSDYERSIVYHIVDARYNAGRAIWLSANIADRKAFETSTSPQIASRLIDSATYVATNWPEYRKLAD